MNAEIKERIEMINKGEVPEENKCIKEWKKYKFEDIAILSTNKYYPKEDAKNYRCIELEHINQETGRINGWSNSIEQKSAKTYFKTGDILYGKLRPYLKKYYLAEFDGVCSTEIWVIKGKTNLVCNEFLFYLIQTEKFNFVANISTGTKMPRADWDYIKSTIFKIPPLPEQRKITEILSTWDKAIELKEQLIEEKKEQKKGLMQKLLRGEIRLPGFGREEAKKTRLKGYIKEIKRKNTKEKINKILSVTNTNGFIEQHEQFDKRVASSNLSNYKIIEKGEFAYNPSRINVGSIDLLRNYEAGVLSPMYIVFKTEKEKLLPEYLYQYVKSDEFYAQIKSFLQGSVRQSLSFKALEMIRLFIPKSLKEQEAIARLLSTADKEIELLEGELEQLKLQKKGLMQLLLTGIIRVKG